MDRFSDNFIRFEMERELQHKKRTCSPTTELTAESKQKIFDKLFLALKDAELVNFLMERVKYGFDPEWDVCRIQSKPFKLNIDVKTDVKDVIPFEVETIKCEKTIEIDDAVRRWASESAIKTYALTTGKTRVSLEDLPYLSKFCR
jgi:hypothetical protein